MVIGVVLMVVGVGVAIVVVVGWREEVDELVDCE